MNVRRGLIRLWVLFSAIWSLTLLGLSAPAWYHAASYWHRSRGIEVSRCEPRLADVLRAGISARHKTLKLSNANLPPLPPGYTLDNPASNPNAIVRPTPDCFSVTKPDGSKYLVAAEKGVWNAAEIKEAALYDTRFLPHHQNGFPDDLTFVDLRADEFIPIGTVITPPELGFAAFVTVLAFLVPVAVLAFGRAICWVAAGFKS